MLQLVVKRHMYIVPLKILVTFYEFTYNFFCLELRKLFFFFFENSFFLILKKKTLLVEDTASWLFNICKALNPY